MDIRTLRYFITIIEEGQIIRAARKLNMSQPPLSRELRNLEEKMGTQLILRDSRKMRLTEAGQKLYEKGKRIVKSFDDMEMEVKETGEGLQGTLPIGTVMSCKIFLPAKLKLFSKKYPKVTFNIMIGDPDRLIELLQNGFIEVAVVRSPINIENFKVIPLRKESFVYIAPAAWNLKERYTSMRLEDIAERPLIALHRVKGTGIYEMLLQEFKEQGVEPHYICESHDTALLLSLVEAEVGGVILPESALFSFSKDHVHVFEITNCHSYTDVSIIMSKEGYISKIAERFGDLFLQDSPA